MKEPYLYVILNGELKMSGGKAAAQAVHAVMMLNSLHRQDFMSDFKRTVIILEAKNTQQLLNLKEYLGNADIDSEYYIDEGVNEVDVYSITALAVAPIEREDKDSRYLFSEFGLYGKKGLFKFYHG